MRGSRFTLAILAVLAACTSDPSVSADVATLVVIPSPLIVNRGLTEQLGVTAYDINGDVIANPALTYSSGDNAVATVSGSGVVTGVAAGFTTIKIKAATESTSVGVSVVLPAPGVLIRDTATITGTNTLQLTPHLINGSNNVVAGASFTYVSRNTAIATVSGSGLVTPSSVVGSTFIVVTSGAFSDSISVTHLVARVTGVGVSFGAAIISGTEGLVTVMNANEVRRINLAGTKGATADVGTLPTSIALNAAKTTAYIGNQDGFTISVVNLSNNAVSPGPTFSSSILAVAVALGDSLLLVTQDNGWVHRIRLPGLNRVDSVSIPGHANAIAFLSDSVAYLSDPDGKVTRLNIYTKATQTILISGTPQGIVIPPGGTEFWLANEVGQFQIWSIPGHAMTGSVPLPHPLGGGGGGFGLARNPANGYAYVSMSYLGSIVAVIDPVAQTVVRTINTAGTPRRIAFTADGAVGIVANEAGWVDIIR